ncbi:MAG: hypothetical protein V4608_01255 [Bacteroidota bacterium]
MGTKFNINESGELDGESISYYKNGEIESKGSFLNKQRHGYWEFYWYTGKLQSSGNYVEGKYNGIWKEYIDGYLHSINTYNDGKLDGHSEAWFSNGLVNWKGRYKNDKEEGEWTFHDIYGNISEKGEYSNGLKVGLWEEGGQIISYYTDGKRISTEKEKQNSKKEEQLEKNTIEAQNFFLKYLIIGLVLIGILAFFILR